MFACRTILAGSKRAVAVAAASRTSAPVLKAQKGNSSIIQLQLFQCGSSRKFATMLSPEDKTKALSNLEAWEDKKGDRDAIGRTYEFENFTQAWKFMSEIAKVADKMDHHPEWFNVYNRVEVTLTTHDCNGVSQKDITLAEAMNACAKNILDPEPLVFKPTCDLYDDYLDDARVPAVSFQSLGGRKQFCGLAVTVKCFEDNSRIKELLKTPGKGKVLVVDGGGSQRCALLGDMIAQTAVDNEWEGLVMYANVRDAEELRKLDVGVMALGAIPRKSVRRGEGQVDLPVQIGDVWCRPGDKVYADENGVLIVD